MVLTKLPSGCPLRTGAAHQSASDATSGLGFRKNPNGNSETPFSPGCSKTQSPPGLFPCGIGWTQEACVSTAAVGTTIEKSPPIVPPNEKLSILVSAWLPSRDKAHRSSVAVRVPGMGVALLSKSTV